MSLLVRWHINHQISQLNGIETPTTKYNTAGKSGRDSSKIKSKSWSLEVVAAAVVAADAGQAALGEHDRLDFALNLNWILRLNLSDR